MKKQLLESGRDIAMQVAPRVICNSLLKRGSHLEFNAIKMLKKISLALLTLAET